MLNKRSNIDCDINLNNFIGIHNTHLLKCYNDMDWRVKPLILSIKRWANCHDINDASKQTLSSYSLWSVDLISCLCLFNML